MLQAENMKIRRIPAHLGMNIHGRAKRLLLCFWILMRCSP